MKATLISHMALPCLLVCFSVSGYGQQLNPYQEEHFDSPKFTGIGTTTVSYQIDSKQKVKNDSELETYLERINGITDAIISEENITVVFEEVIRGQEISMIFQRVEMLHLESKSKK